jgi:hypothetical protein
MTTFAFSARGQRRRRETPTFKVGRLWSEEAGSRADLSHLIDKTYPYHSVRELKWHLAERFRLRVADVELTRC